MPGTDVPVYLVEQNDYFDRPELYLEEGEDYRDNCERFTFFCRAVLEAIPLLDLQTDLIHCHDWCAALIPAYLKTLYRDRPPFDGIASLYTIHNSGVPGKLLALGTWPSPASTGSILIGGRWSFMAISTS